MKKFIKHFEKAVAHNQANDKKKSFHVTYKKLNGRTVKRKIDPVSIRNNVVVAFDHKRQALRSFKVERLKGMEKAAFWEGFNKQANAALELAGLGTLAIPSIQGLRGKHMKDSTKDKLEVAGLGILAAPYAKEIAMKAWGKMKPMVPKVQPILSKVL